MSKASEKTVEESKDRLLDELISCEIGSYTCSYAPERAVVTISNLCNLTGLPRYGARKALRSLIADGLVKYTSQGCPAIVSYGECPELVEEARPPINGYTLTKAAFQTDRWKKAYKDWEDGMREWANRTEGNGYD